MAALSTPGLPDGEQEVVHVIDITPRGLAVRSDSAIAVGERVLLEDDRMAVVGIVRHCTPDGSDFTLGIEIDEGDLPPEYGPKLLGA